MKESPSRREFVRRVSAIGAVGVAGAAMPLALKLAAAGEAAAQAAAPVAQGAEDYKALVCVFLYGGNDPYNTVVPYDAESHARYFRIRADIALARDKLDGTVLRPREAGAGGRVYALAPTLAPLKPWFEREALAVQLNVGPMVVPTTKAEYIGGKVPMPPKLFSHNDQQSYWQGLAPEGAASGWGGRLADLFAAGNGNSTFANVTAGGTALLLSGSHVSAYRVSPAGSTPIELLRRDTYGSTACTDLLRSLLTQPGPHLFQQQIAATLARSIRADAQLGAALEGVDVRGDFGTPLGAQLKIVARMIAARRELGVKRQVFFVSQNGYDNHDGLNGTHPGLLAELGGALAQFQQAMDGLGLGDRVTTFTASEFGRTLVSNGDGSDHGWGGHHFVLGGAVRGGRFYGTQPDWDIQGPGYVDHGRLLPRTSVEEFGATLGAWFGADAGALDDVFPHLRNFGTRDVGFMRRA
ncbi:DUF1501 domain-containing protein [Bordetella genomosp. 11]|uniref:Tat pathway signal protein n=1 Tax=Bordetella genomosp. 11 TaxID=1416808 RepID=A0A261UMY9_9BORD|nr:DUF1501 domain-containing protein [Bordetella genomosp. 11]OZI62273.1 Tat pathway signal protein [Bordetella genomosp. 11]